MNTKLKALVIEEHVVIGHGFDRILSDKGHNISTHLNAANEGTKTDEGHTTRSLIKTTGMLIAAPLIALGYVIALPFIGLYHFAKLAHEAYTKRHPTVAGKLKRVGLFARNVGLFLISPFIALAYVIALPFVGITMFAKLALEANNSRHSNC